MKKDNHEDSRNNKNRLKITELFMARAGKKDWNHCYYGSITRHQDEDGREVSVSGKIDMKNGYTWAEAQDKEELGAKLDELATILVMHGIDYRKRNVMYIAANELNIN
mgnify:CR=1 FL=1